MSAYEGKSHPPPLHNYDTGRTYNTENAYSYTAPTYSSHSAAAAVPIAAPIYHNATPISPLTYPSSRASYENPSDQYLHVGSNPVPEVTSYSPQTGRTDTKFNVYITTLFELPATNLPICYLTFGHRRCQATLQKVIQQNSHSYAVTCDVPPFSSTNSTRSTVSVYISLENGDGGSIPKVDVGSFLYLDCANQTGHERIQDESSKRKMSSASSSDLMKSPLKRSQSQQLRPKEEYGAYPYPQSESLQNYPAYMQPNAQYNTSMVSQYGRPTAGYQVAPRQAYGYSGSASSPAIKTAQSPHTGNWNSGYANNNSNLSRSSGITSGGNMNRPSLSALPSPGVHRNPKLVRASTITQISSPATTPHSGQNFPSYSPFPQKVILNLEGDLDAMGNQHLWSQEELHVRRRLIHFTRWQVESTVTARLIPVLQDKRTSDMPDSSFVSCIYWEEKQATFITSVDTIKLLELLLGYEFSVEEKNRIRRNLEGFHPTTISKGKTESEELFKLIMAFPNPKPRHIEKDVKVFKFSDLPAALKKIMGKFCASPASVVGPYKATNDPSNGYGMESPSAGISYTNDHYHGPSSPRSVSGSTTFAAYTLPARIVSPHDQRSVSLQGSLSMRNPSSNLHESAGHWQNNPPHMHNSQQYMNNLPQLPLSNRNSWDMPYLDHSQMSAGTPTPTQHAYNYSAPRHGNVADSSPGSDNRISRNLPSSQSQQVPRS